MRDNIVHRPIDLGQIFPCFSVLLLRRHLLRPPRNVIDAIPRSGLSLQHQELSLKIRSTRFQNAVLRIMAFCSAHGEEVIAFQLEDLSTHQVQDMRANAVYLAAVPVFHRISFQRVVVFMIPADKGQREWQVFQPVQCSLVTAVSKPHTTKVSGTDHDVPLCHLCLLREIFRLEAFKVSVAITGCKNHLSTFFQYIIFWQISTPPFRVTAISSLERIFTVSTSWRTALSSHSVMWSDAFSKVCAASMMR